VESFADREARRRVLRELAERVEAEPSRLAGVVNFHEGGPEVGKDLADGAHRLDGGRWQFTVVAGRVVRAVRLDMRHYLVPETVHPADEAPPEATPPKAKATKGKAGA